VNRSALPFADSACFREKEQAMCVPAQLLEETIEVFPALS